MHELSKQFLRPSSPSGSQKSSRYKQMEDVGGYICLYFQTTVFQRSLMYTSGHHHHTMFSCSSFNNPHSFSGRRTPPDPRSPISPTPQPADRRTGERRRERGRSQAPTPGTPRGAPRSTETEAAPRTPTTSSPESRTPSSSRSPRTATRLPGCPGPASTAPT